MITNSPILLKNIFMESLENALKNERQQILTYKQLPNSNSTTNTDEHS